MLSPPFGKSVKTNNTFIWGGLYTYLSLKIEYFALGNYKEAYSLTNKKLKTAVSLERMEKIASEVKKYFNVSRGVATEFEVYGACTDALGVYLESTVGPKLYMFFLIDHSEKTGMIQKFSLNPKSIQRKGIKIMHYEKLHLGKSLTNK